jgi:CRISPR-associated protein Csh1
MLNTLLKIGKWQSEGMGEWDRFIEKPNISKKDRNEQPITNLIAGLIFDLDENRVYCNHESLREYDELKGPSDFKLLKIQGGNNKAIYPTVETKKLIQLFKTFFGKLDEEKIPMKGELLEVLENESTNNSHFTLILEKIFSLRDNFLEQFLKEGETDKLDPKKIIGELGLGNNENLIFIYACFKSEELGYFKPKPISQIKEFNNFLISKFLEDKPSHKKNEVEKLCYATGKYAKDIKELNLTTRYSLNKMFVTETRNYAGLFDKKAFIKNYQLSEENQISLDLASTFLLEKYKTRIAGLDHVIIPQFLESEDIDFNYTLEKLKTGADLLFTVSELAELSSNVEIETNNTYWINFLAFESDGNFFKTTSLIKDVSKFHFQKVIQAFSVVNWEMYSMNRVVDWDSVMTEYGKVVTYNFNTIYSIIPLRKNKEKKNVALQLFKSILENRKVGKAQLFVHFCENVLCHYYERYSSYTNVRKYGKDYFDFAVRDAVFKYLAFFQVLKKLKLINMEQESNAIPAEEVVNDFDKRIENFFSRMEFNEPQKAMFFLGRVLSSVKYMQRDKKKTVIEKVNYNGMEKDQIMRLKNDLFDKARQYGKSDKIIFNLSNFENHFKSKNWNMSPQEAVFYLLTGLSFGIVKSDDNNDSDSVENNNNQ